MPALIIIAVVVLIIVIAYFSYLHEKKRREALAKMAASLELTFSPNDPFNLPGRLGHIGHFSRGHSRRAKNVVHGSYRNCEVMTFDFKYTTTQHTKNGKRNVDHHFSALVHPLELRFPQLTIRPEGFLDKIGDFIGFDDIDFESDEFSRQFRVTSENRKFAYDVCHARAMEWLLANRGWHIELVGGYFTLTLGERRWQPEEFHSAMSFTCKFFEMIPDFVVREYREKQVEG